jgi:restriction endonuclease S subunit
LKIKLTDIAEIKTGYTQASKAQLDTAVDQVNLYTSPAVGLKSITNDGEIDFSKLDRVFTPFSAGTKSKLTNSAIRVGDLVLAARGSSGKAGVVRVITADPVVITGNVLLVRPNPELADSTYLQALFQSVYTDPKQESFRKGVLDQWSITRNDLEQFELEIPPLPEQQKISTAFLAIQEARRSAQAVTDHYGFLLEKLSTKYFR